MVKKKPPSKKGLAYTPTSAVKSTKPGIRGGVWHGPGGKVVGTSKSEDSPFNKRGTKRASTRSARPR